MSTTAIRGVLRRRVSDRYWRLTVVAGGLAVAGMASALSGVARILIVALSVAAVTLAAWLLVPAAAAAVRRNRAWILFAVALVAVALWLALGLVGAANAGPGGGVVSLVRVVGVPVLPLLTILVAAAAGMVLVADAVRIWLGLAPHQRAPWKQMTADTTAWTGGIAWRAVAGVLLVGLAAFLAVDVSARFVAGRPVLEVMGLLVIAGGVALVLGTPIAIGASMRLARDRAGSAHDRERQRFAAHLHDSVLQTLALVQRQAHDPIVVARLARRQEHALRAWMAGEAELVSDTLVAALRDVAAGVEEEHDITVEFTAIGDRALDSSCEELVAAAREALRNVGRHARGAPVFVFCQTGPDGRIELFIRDEGPGFDPAAVPAGRRGIRDAIVGRMAFAGGQAEVDSVCGEGTEVTLRLPPRRGSR